MDTALQVKLYSFTIDCEDPEALAAFYAALLFWEKDSDGKDYAWANPPGVKQGAYPGILFQRNEGYAPPVWPDEPGAQQQMAHIDIAVNELDSAVAHAKACGATVAGTQYSKEWTVMLDPAGHPFCLCLVPQTFFTGA